VVWGNPGGRLGPYRWRQKKRADPWPSGRPAAPCVRDGRFFYCMISMGIVCRGDELHMGGSLCEGWKRSNGNLVWSVVIMFVMNSFCRSGRRSRT
jgi:hypothetical protein